eukprot:Protomagalhaensia_wolfi_Nauph_80__6154@NODE_8_length_5760_cov_41_165705_g6_i0_p2_GENE_NODE_8_length_5760_cov_41_165705_g6_i0NODE_8_length_5760_cov_41_165705_g6_i0_p2_ORF_typecomplete_len316_score31_06PSI/PF01437_25/5_9_NODE_8_length_5760_cov_41_165705_g6_i021173064
MCLLSFWLLTLGTGWARFRDQLSWGIQADGKTPPFNQLYGRAFCIDSNTKTRCEGVCNYDKHWIPFTELDRVCNKHMPYGIPILFDVKYYRRNAVPWCWLSPKDQWTNYTAVALDLSTLNVNHDLSEEGILPELKVVLKRMYKWPFLEASYQTRPWPEASVPYWKAEIGAIPRDRFIGKMEVQQRCYADLSVDLSDYVIEDGVFDLHIPPPFVMPNSTFDLSWVVPRHYWNSRDKYIFFVKTNGTEPAVSRLQTITKLRADFSVPKYLVTDFYCERFRTCATCAKSASNCRWCEMDGQPACSHFCSQGSILECTG